MPSQLTDDEIRARIDALNDKPRYRHIDLLGAIARRAVDGLRVPDGITLGLGEIDQLTRGFRPQDLVLVTGFSHSGKTQLVNTMILNNPDKRILFISLDDPAEMIVTKLVAMHCKTSAETL
jgi:replicative DNA helicase